MTAYVVRRLLWLPVLLVIVIFITFALGTYGPGDPVEVRLGTKSNPEAVARLRQQMGLDRPFVVQFADYVGGVVRGDFGDSYRYQGRTVLELILPRMWVSAQLNLVALTLVVVIGIPLGMAAARFQGRWLDPAIVTGIVFISSLPVLITGPLFLLVFVVILKLVPSAGWGGLFDTRIIIPAVAIAVPGLAVIVRVMRTSTLEVLSQDYVRTAYAKGLTPGIISRRHVARNAFLPVLTMLGFSIAGLIGGTIIGETIFGIPGIGRLAFESIFNRDYPVIMGITIIGAATFVLANLMIDVAYTFLDPRIRY
ncbi:MAG: ABC transporter permease [Dehalococcoidia bacterium]|nr:ABC transporter permease [Dehalococcoidia bacterium]